MPGLLRHPGPGCHRPRVFGRLLCGFALLLGSTAWAADVDGVQIAESARVGTGGPQLTLNGAGTRVRMIFRIYVAA